MTGHTVGITTAPDRMRRLKGIAEAQGLAATSLPCINVTPVADAVLAHARRTAADADLIFVTSSRAIAALWPAGGMPGVPAAAVGESTAHEIRKAGGRARVVGDAGAATLIEEIRPDMAGADVFYPHGSNADPGIGVSLESLCRSLTSTAVYEVEPVAPGPDPVDAVIFGSPSAVEGWCLSRSLASMIIAAIGKSTGRALRDRGYGPDVVPDTPSFERVARDLSTHLRKGSTQ